MGNSASADIYYGVVIGDSEGSWNFKYDEDGWLPAPWNFPEDGSEIEHFDSDALEALLDEFLGASGDYGARATVRAASHIRIENSGYEYGTSSVVVSGCGVHVWDYGTERFDDLQPPSEEQARELVRFITFLETKNLVLEDEHRNPGWFLAASYG